MTADDDSSEGITLVATISQAAKIAGVPPNHVIKFLETVNYSPRKLNSKLEPPIFAEAVVNYLIRQRGKK